MGCRAHGPSLTGFFLSCLFLIQTFVTSVFVLLSLRPLMDSIMLMCVCVYVCTHMYVFNNFSASHAFFQLSPYSLGKYLLTSYSVPVMVLDAELEP